VHCAPAGLEPATTRVSDEVTAIFTTAELGLGYWRGTDDADFPRRGTGDHGIYAIIAPGYEVTAIFTTAKGWRDWRGTDDAEPPRRALLYQLSYGGLHHRRDSNPRHAK
jgi:hypothetical protein